MSTNNSFYLKVAGVTFEGRQKIIKKLNVGDELKLVREPTNPYDQSAIAIFTAQNEQIGYIPSNNAKQLAYKMDKGSHYKVTVSTITGGGIGMSYGVNIYLEEQ